MTRGFLVRSNLHKPRLAIMIIVTMVLCVNVYLLGHFDSLGNGSDFSWTAVVAVLTTEERLTQRSAIRATTKQFPQVYCKECDTPHIKPRVRLLFFIGRQKNGKFRNETLLHQENALHDDLVLLNITENMNDGKVWEVFNWIYYHESAEFAMKSDDDSFVNVPGYLARLDHLKASYSAELVAQTRTKYDLKNLTNSVLARLYFGFPWAYSDVPVLPANEAIMVGMGYTLGHKLVQLAATAHNVTKLGREDEVTNGWTRRKDFQPVLRIGDRVRFQSRPGYKPKNRQPCNSCWSYRCDNVVIHQLKTSSDWEPIKNFYFNCCPPFDTNRGPQCDAPMSDVTCCKEGCDRLACAKHLRLIGAVDPDDYWFSDENLDYLKENQPT